MNSDENETENSQHWMDGLTSEIRDSIEILDGGTFQETLHLVIIVT